MLRLSKLADYATLIVNCLAAEEGTVLSSAVIAEQTGLPTATVSKLLKQLTKAEIVLSQRGGQGGYALSKKPQEISLMALIDAIEGEWGFIECSVSEGVCKQEPSCVLKHNWQYIDGMIRQMLSSISVADMRKPLSLQLPSHCPSITIQKEES